MLRNKADAIGVLAACAAATSLIVSLGSTKDALACFGFTPLPPDPECIRTYSFGIEIPETFTADLVDPIIVRFNATHFVSLAETVPAAPVCPPGPFTVFQTVDVACDAGPPIPPIDLPPFDVLPGHTPQTGQTLEIPPGPPRICSLTVDSEVAFSDGTSLIQTQKQRFCVVESSPDDPAIPRLKLERLDPDNDVHRVNPGDQAAFTYIITNNDPINSWTGTINADMRNVAGEPTALGGLTRFNNVQIVSDPVLSIDGDIGDNFPIAFPSDIPQGQCVPLPPDPGGFAIPNISDVMMLLPGESAEVIILTRPWPMCADGSCGQSLVSVEGTFANGDPALACSSAAIIVDNDAPPTFQCPGSGVPGEFLQPFGPPTSFAAPIPDQPFLFYDFFANTQLPNGEPPVVANGDPVPADVQILNGPADLGRWSGRGTVQVNFPPSFDPPPGTPIEVTYLFEFTSGPFATNPQVVINHYDQIPTGPQGLENIAPGFMGELGLPSLDPAIPDAEAEVTHQLAGRWEDPNEAPTEVQFIDVSTQVVSPSAVVVHATVAAPPASGRSNVPDTLLIANDFRAFYRPAGDDPPACPADTDGDLLIGLDDLLTVLGNFGEVVAGGPADGDIDPIGAPDNLVGLDDLLLVLGEFGNSCL